MTLSIGAVLSQANAGTDPSEIRRCAVEAEAAGFKHLMVGCADIAIGFPPGPGHAR
jgi:hypothetical protein